MADLKIPYLNRIIVCGKLTSEAEYWYVHSGRPVALLRMEIDNKTALEHEEEPRYTHISIVVWNMVDEIAEARPTKDMVVLVEGRLKSRFMEDDDGTALVEIVAQSVQFLDNKAAE